MTAQGIDEWTYDEHVRVWGPTRVNGCGVWQYAVKHYRRKRKRSFPDEPQMKEEKTDASPSD